MFVAAVTVKHTGFTTKDHNPPGVSLLLVLWLWLTTKEWLLVNEWHCRIGRKALALPARGLYQYPYYSKG